MFLLISYAGWFLLAWNKLELPRKGNLIRGVASNQISLWVYLLNTVLFVDWCQRAAQHGRYHPRQVDLGCLRVEGECEFGSSFPPGSCLCSSPSPSSDFAQWPAVIRMCKPKETFLPQVVFGQNVCHSNRSLTETYEVSRFYIGMLNYVWR